VVASAIVDSNVFVGLLRRGCDPVRELANWIGDGEIITCGMVRMEVERGIKSPRLRRHLGGFFDVMLYRQTTNRIWENASRMAWELDRKGLVLPSQDILIATIAKESCATVLTDDSHFAHIPGIHILKPSDVLPAWK